MEDDQFFRTFGNAAIIQTAGDIDHAGIVGFIIAVFGGKQAISLQTVGKCCVDPVFFRDLAARSFYVKNIQNAPG